ncbi:hypothetical protein A2115_02395 [Candidatus Woesebacteria bacterium GWA1_41_8]|jgi:hypothetical protein|uniref:Uncharacterized protein n=1 Tax=Candidatus Woesebacteria bacterium GWA1_41_8 TaxID=1802471 RepID=A0A1F7WJV2_9BACT|nr:MAG: hypothetical protein A2115_02395 [Candidatus Woesebacteria bacterium GWA1_41_8]
MNSKKFFGWVVVFLFVVIDIAALDDITTGGELNPSLEYLILAVTFPYLGYFSMQILAVKIFKAVRWAARKTPFGDYHIHHSTLGLLLVLLGILTPITLIKVTLVGFGLGMFTHHTQTEGLIFVTKYKKDSYHKIVKHP